MFTFRDALITDGSNATDCREDKGFRHRRMILLCRSDASNSPMMNEASYVKSAERLTSTSESISMESWNKIKSNYARIKCALIGAIHIILFAVACSISVRKC